jgi:hypothetical protein
MNAGIFIFNGDIKTKISYEIREKVHVIIDKISCLKIKNNEQNYKSYNTGINQIQRF